MYHSYLEQECEYDSFIPLLPSYSNILSDECEGKLPDFEDYCDHEEDNLFEGCQESYEEKEEENPRDEILTEENSVPELEESGRRFNSKLSQKELKTGKKGKCSRKKDQNMCKKYNVVALNVLVKKLKLEAQVEIYKKDKYRQDFFLLMVMVAEKAGKLESFKKYYRSEIQKNKISCTQLMKQTFKDSPEYKKHQALLDAIGRSFSCIELFEEGKLEEAVDILFDLKNLRNKNFIEKSKQFVRENYLTIQTL